MKELVLTGGPCSGKTTALGYLQEKLSDFGFRVFLVPEAPTIVILGGVNDIASLDPVKRDLVQKEMILMHQQMRKTFINLSVILRRDKRVIIYDRGIMDFKAYMDPNVFLKFLESELGTSEIEERDSYDAVIHLVTTASGAEEFYTLENNPARYEKTLEQARRADSVVLAQWLGHPHLRVVDNSTGFEGKMKRTLQSACRVLGIPVPLEIEKKFLLREMPNVLPVEHQVVAIEQMYLVSPDDRRVRIRKRTQNGGNIYYRTCKTTVKPGVRHETEERISKDVYNELTAFQKPKSKIISKHRYCFVWKSQYFELDCFLSPERVRGTAVLEIELTEENDKVELPPWLNLAGEVTNSGKYSNYSIACYNT